MKNRILLAIILLSTILIVSISIFIFISVDTAEQTQKNDSNDTILNTADASNQKKLIPLSEKDFIVDNNNTFIELGGKHENLKTDEKTVSTNYADAKHAYDTFAFENFSITTEPNAEGVIESIVLITPVLKTNRGIGIGNSLTDVYEKYGTIDDHSSE